MGNRKWDINHQNNDGDTFAHILGTIDYKYVMELIKKLKAKKNFIPNIKNNNGETILDKSIKNNYISTTIRILEDNRFNNIDLVSFKNLFDAYINSNNYGKYTRLNTLEIVIDNLEDKPLLPSVEKTIELIKTNFEIIKEEIVSSNKPKYLNSMLNTMMKESRA